MTANNQETQITIESLKPAEQVIIWMHGLGADGNDFVPIVEELDFPGKEFTRFIFPHAPVMPVSINGGMMMRAWYDILQADLTRRVDMAGIMASVEQLAHLVASENQKGIPLEKMVLAGFSQGGVIALQTALHLNLPLAGVMALSSYLPLRDSIDNQQKQKIFLAHGVDDGVVPYNEALSSLDWLRQHGHDVTWHNYAMMHSVCAEEIADISGWLASLN